MSNEPRICLKSLTSRVELEDYAKVIQIVDTEKDADGSPKYKDVSSLVRVAVHQFVSSCALDQQHSEWVDVQRERNASRRTEKRAKRRSFLGRMFGR